MGRDRTLIYLLLQIFRARKRRPRKAAHPCGTWTVNIPLHSTVRLFTYTSTALCRHPFRDFPPIISKVRSITVSAVIYMIGAGVRLKALSITFACMTECFLRRRCLKMRRNWLRQTQKPRRFITIFLLQRIIRSKTSVRKTIRRERLFQMTEM